MKRRIILPTGCLALAALAFGLGDFGGGPPVHVAIVRDCSGSNSGGCGSVVALGARALSMPDLGFDSRLWVLATGSLKTSFQPVLIGEYALNLPARAIEGKAGADRRRNEFLAKIADDCEKITKTQASPIFLAAKQAVAQLGVSGCRNDRKPCYLFVESDLEETVVASVKQAIAQPAGSGLENLPAPLDNKNIQVAFCGLAETIKTSSVKTGPNHVDRLREVWLALFKYPGLVSFEPYCPR